MRAVNIQKVIDTFSDMLKLNGSTVRFELTEGTVVDVMASDINRVPADLTDGMSQDRNVIRVMGDAWHVAAGSHRRPEKGDRVTLGGRRYAIESARPAQFQNTLVGYVITLRG